MENLISHTEGRGADIKQNSNVNDIVRSINLVSEDTSSERRDWSVSNNTQLLPTNERQARKQIVQGVS